MTSRWDPPGFARVRNPGSQSYGWGFRCAAIMLLMMGIAWAALGGNAALAQPGTDGKDTKDSATAPATTPATSAATTTPAPATPTAPPTRLDALPSLVELYQTSPLINGIIIALSIVALLLFIYFLLTINHNAIVPAAFLDDVMKMVLDRDYKQAVEFCRHHRTIFISTVIQRCVENVGRDHSVLMTIVDTEGKRRADILWNRISYLADISNVTPMLGLLGTIVGMMGAFFGLDQSTIDMRSKFISSNIAGAMGTTFFGLVVAIAALVFHSIIKGRLTRVLSEAEQAVHAVTDHIKRGEVKPH